MDSGERGGGIFAGIMLDVPASDSTVKYKRRKVSAVRDFPRGCGPNAPKLLGYTIPVAAEPVVIAGAQEALSLPNGTVMVADLDQRLSKTDPAKLNVGGGEGSSELVQCGVDGAVPEMKAPEEVGKSEAEKMAVEKSEPVNGLRKEEDMVIKCVLKKYPPPQRRKISAIRDFPAGCGPNAPPVVQKACSGGASGAAALEDENLVVGKKGEEAKQDMVNGLDNQEGAMDIWARVVAPAVSEAKSWDMEEKPLEGSNSIVDSSKDVESAENVGYNMKKDESNLIRDIVEIANEAVASYSAAAAAASRANSVDEGMDLSVKQNPVAELAVEVASVDKVDIELLQMQDITPERSDKIQVKSAEKSGSIGDALEGETKKIYSVKPVSEKKMEAAESKQAIKSRKFKEAQESMPSLSAVSSPSRSKVVDRDARRLVVKVGDKGSSKGQTDVKKLERMSMDEDNKALVVSTQGHEAVEAYGSRLIVQALMSAQNCPWTRGKKSHAGGVHSVTPRNTAKKQEKPSYMTYKEVVIYQGESAMVSNDEGDSLLGEDEVRHALVSCKRPTEFDVCLTPMGSAGSNVNSGNNSGVVTRSRVKRVLRLFQVIFRKLLQGEEARKKDLNGIRRIDLAAANILKQKNETLNKGQAFVGNVPGVEVGDEFHYRVELSIVGLHRPYQGGIDTTKLNGLTVATSIVASGGYPDDMDSTDVLIYSGSGGNPQKGDKQPGDQKLERGNLALKNSIDAKTPVRVIYGFKEQKGSESPDSRAKLVSTFTFDGLYLVEDYWKEKGPHGFAVFKFRLRRMPGQPDIGLKVLKKSKKSETREGLCVMDISNGEEIIPISVVNTIDDDRPACFKYITKRMYPSWYIPARPAGCDCNGRCIDSENCACAVKNGGEIPFNFSGSIIQAKPLVYECGPSCKCPPSCYNRVSQHGIKIPLEVFKTTSRGWGVRSLISIPSGSFVCEYSGEVLQDSEAEQRSNDEYLFDIGHNYDDKSLWEGLPSVTPTFQSNPLGETEDDVGFTIDAAEFGNVGRFINHSCSPNLYAQNVLYDHGDKKVPHVMLFAADNIPPLQELTYDYNYTVDHVRDSEGNIKRKDCYCGSHECTGRLY